MMPVIKATMKASSWAVANMIAYTATDDRNPLRVVHISGMWYHSHGQPQEIIVEVTY